MVDTSPLTDIEQERYETLREALQHDHDPEAYTGPCLIRSSMDGLPLAVIAWSSKEGESYSMIPMAVLLSDELFERLDSPMEDL